MRKLTSLVASVAATLALASCGGGGGGSGFPVAGTGTTPATTQPPQPAASAATRDEIQASLDSIQKAGIRFVKELGERKAVEVTDSTTGNVFSYLGQRDARGGLAELEAVVLQKPNGERVTSEIVSGTQRLISNDTAKLLITAKPDGTYELKFSDMASGVTHTTTSTELGLAPKATPASNQKAPVTLQAPASHASQFPVQVTVKTCGLALDRSATVLVALKGATGVRIGDYRAQKTGTNTFMAYLPDPNQEIQATIDNIKYVLEAFNEVMGIACSIEEAQPLTLVTTCAVLGAQLASTAIGLPIAAGFLTLCEGAAVVTKAYCLVTKFTTLPLPGSDAYDPATSDFFAEIVSSFLVDSIPIDLPTAQVTPHIDALPRDIPGKAVTVPSALAQVYTEIDDLTNCEYTGSISLSGLATGPVTRQCSGTGSLSFTGTTKIKLSATPTIEIDGDETLAYDCLGALPSHGTFVFPLTISGDALNGSYQWSFICEAPCVAGTSLHVVALTASKDAGGISSFTGTLDRTLQNAIQVGRYSGQMTLSRTSPQ